MNGAGGLSRMGPSSGLPIPQAVRHRTDNLHDTMSLPSFMGCRVLVCWTLMEHHDICLFAETNFRNQRKRFGIRRKDRRHHVYILGKTGMGKSTLLEHLISADLHAGAGLAVLDPHGDLVKRVRECVPEHRKDEVIYFDPSDERYALPFNVLQDSYTQRYLIASGVLGAFKKVWGDSWGPRMEHIFRHALLGLLALPHATLLDVPRILMDKKFRERALVYIDDAQIRSFFKDEFEHYSAYFRQEAISPILNKVGHFLANPLLRKVIGHRENALRFREIMDTGKVVLANLLKGALGEDSSSLLGALILSQIERAALSRADLPEGDRRDFYLFVDEFSNFATTSFVGMLSEARKYGVHLTLCNQLLAQVEETMRAAIFGNVGTLMTFQVGAEDAEYLVKEFTPTLTEEDLVSLPQYHIYVKLMVEGTTSQPFSAVTLPPPEHIFR
ncbi:MAG: type IV secretion system DNA-binding domain-containing protein [Candidatus Latescibacteria bacterium]|nr:type IV secretion system DNA-binding domain-containing protein [Candidatus Latescibacterota bacterium]